MQAYGRRYHPAGTTVVARTTLGGPRRRSAQADSLRMRGGNLVRSLTPRQAVLWLMNLDQVGSNLPRSIKPHFTREARNRLARALRARVGTREGFSRRRLP